MTQEFLLADGEVVIHLPDASEITFELFGDEGITGDFDLDHTGIDDGKPDAFCWSFVTPFSFQEIPEEKQDGLSGRVFSSSLFLRFTAGEKFRYFKNGAHFIRFRPLTDEAKKMGVRYHVG